MAMDLVRLGERITELRGDRSPADIARRGGFSAAYLYAVERATPGRTGEPARPKVPFLRALADVLGPAAKRSELLELAGWDDHAAYDRVQEMKAERLGVRPALDDEQIERLEGLLADVAEELRRARGSDGSPQHRQPGVAG